VFRVTSKPGAKEVPENRQCVETEDGVSRRGTRFAELLVDTFGGCLAHAQSIQARIRREAQNWKLKRVNVGL
jgi:hypothetical protein